MVKDLLSLFRWRIKGACVCVRAHVRACENIIPSAHSFECLPFNPDSILSSSELIPFKLALPFGPNHGSYRMYSVCV